VGDRWLFLRDRALFERPKSNLVPCEQRIFVLPSGSAFRFSPTAAGLVEDGRLLSWNNASVEYRLQLCAHFRVWRCRLFVVERSESRSLENRRDPAWNYSNRH